MNWQCPRCETFNRNAQRCEVCELARPSKKAATKTATETTGKNSHSSLVAPPKSAQNGALAKPAEKIEAEKLSFKVVDRRSSAMAAKPVGDVKPIATTPKTPDSPKPAASAAVQPSATPGAGAAVIDAISWLVLIGFNVYSLYDFIAVQQLGIGWLILGMVWQNFFLILIIGAVSTFLKWLLIPPPDSTK